MLRTILKYGVIAGLVVGGFMVGTVAAFSGMPPLKYGMLIGYTTMLIALSAVFVGIKQHRDVDRGGVIGFWPAFGVGLGVTVARDEQHRDRSDEHHPRLVSARHR